RRHGFESRMRLSTTPASSGVGGFPSVVDDEAPVAVERADAAARVVGLDEIGLELRVEDDHAIAVAQALPVADLPEIVEDPLRLLRLQQLPAAVEGDPTPQVGELVEEPVAVAARRQH